MCLPMRMRTDNSAAELAAGEHHYESLEGGGGAGTADHF